MVSYEVLASVFLAPVCSQAAKNFVVIEIGKEVRGSRFVLDAIGEWFDFVV